MIVPLQFEHILQLDEAFQKQGWPSRKEILTNYLREQEKGERIVLVAEEAGVCKDYITLIKQVKEGPFYQSGIPEIADFNVFEDFQNQGIGWQLLDAICQLASEFTDIVGIGVGLNANYGKAQRLYVKHGFIPDGSGVWYRGRSLPVGAKAYNDDELALYFTKKL
ncbi:GNAT family N-acetyltransferase [Streptococcus suis]|uniref:GNAT family N-acetyltransferase n=1 Tax=Streptococcus suis TaxID=1307 RepID=UPI003756E9F5